jgi:hypothetical protein
MRKTAYFDEHWGDGWPQLRDIAPILIDPVRRTHFFAAGRDGGSFKIEGQYGTEGLTPQTGLIKTTLYIHMNPDHGVKLQYSQWDGRINQLITHHSKGDQGRLREFVHSFHGSPLSIGLFISFDQGWQAIKEFIGTDGKLSGAIEWIDDRDLPPEIFPDP